MSAGLGWGPKLFVSNHLPGAAEAAALKDSTLRRRARGTAPRVDWCWNMQCFCTAHRSLPLMHAGPWWEGCPWEVPVLNASGRLPSTYPGFVLCVFASTNLERPHCNLCLSQVFRPIWGYYPGQRHRSWHSFLALCSLLDIPGQSPAPSCSSHPTAMLRRRKPPFLEGLGSLHPDTWMFSVS